MDASRFDHLTRRLAPRATRRTALGSALAGLAVAALEHASASGRSVPEATPDTEEKPTFLFVQTSLTGRGEINPNAGTPEADATPVAGGGASFLLTLDGHSGQTIYFSDRPDRVFGAAPTQFFLDELGFSPVNPPNAALVAEFKSGQGVVVVELVSPVYDAESDTLTYGVEVLQGYKGDGLSPVTSEEVAAALPGEFTHASLFIDDCPDWDECWRPGFIDKYIGPIPGGPYGACWQGLLDGCEPCWTTEAHLQALCNDAYEDCDGRCIVGA